jgi:hypothetical protein
MASQVGTTFAMPPLRQTTGLSTYIKHNLDCLVIDYAAEGIVKLLQRESVRDDWV